MRTASREDRDILVVTNARLGAGPTLTVSNRRGGGPAAAPPPPLPRTAARSRESVPSDFGHRVLQLERPADWNGDGARAIPGSTCRAALALVKRLRRACPHLELPRASPSPRGGVTLTWSRGGNHFTVRVTSSRPRRFTYEWEADDYSFGSGAGDLQDLVFKLTTHLQLAEGLPSSVG